MIIFNRKLGITVTTKAIIAYTTTIIAEFREKNIISLYNWCYRFMKRNNLSIRYASHLGQKYPENTIDNIYYFFHQLIAFRRDLVIGDDRLDLLVNCDETAIFFEELEKKTVSLKGVKDITINTFGNDKKRLSLLLSVCGDGKKLALLIIFKGQKNKTIEKKLNNLDIVKNKKFL